MLNNLWASFAAPVACRPVATGGHSGAVPPKFLLCPPKFSCSQKICFKNVIKTKIVPPKNVFYPSKPQNLATGLVAWDQTKATATTIEH